MGFEYYAFAFFVFVLACVVIFISYKLFSGNRRQIQILEDKEKKLLNLYKSVEYAMEEFYDSAAKGVDEIELKMEEFRAMQNIRLPSQDARRKMEQQVEMRVASPPAAAAAAPPAPAPVFSKNLSDAIHQTVPEPQKPVEQKPSKQTGKKGQKQSGNKKGPKPPSAAAAASPPGSAAASSAPPPSMAQAAGDVKGEQARPPLQKQPVHMDDMDAPRAQEPFNRNEQVLSLSQKGKNRVEIAQELNITLGEVDLVLQMAKA